MSKQAVGMLTAAMTALLVSSPAAAQVTASPSPAVRTGDIVWVTSAGRTTKGKVSSVSPDAIVIAANQPTTFKRADIQQIDRQVLDSSRDGLWKGALIGAGVGAVLALTADGCSGTGCIVDRGDAVGILMILGAGIGAPAGYAIDVTHHGRESIPLASLGAARVGVRPVVSPSRVGSQLTILW